MRNSKDETGLTREERLQIMLSPEELKAVDNFRFSIICRLEQPQFVNCFGMGLRRRG